MTDVSIDSQPEAVKQFFKSLQLTASGSIVKMNGRSVARVMPADGDSAVADAHSWTPDLNHRRCDLIDKKFAEGLTPAESTELATLTAGLRAFVDRVAPLPFEDVRRLHQQLLEKAALADPAE